ncbi:hypothetical protein Cgig2_019786 [Carnegiea gigantea]|uniref:Transposase n=1 Tax=Carnegiea gigantea TaxID=171969 RepID=A0A9Q1KE88_9CARY|nr:hypothetical protein Cgig2_019786 [Carnegiea gigantea]
MVSIFRVTKNVVVHCKDRMITIVDVNLDMYQGYEGLAVEQRVVLPTYAGFKWHPPGRENQRWPFNTDNDWVMLAHQWESIRGFVIPIYVVELHVPSQLQKVVESLDGLQKAKEKKTVQFTSPCEPTLDPSLTEASMWADNLIVTPSSIYIDPNAAVQVQPMSKVLARRPLTRSQSSPSTKSAAPTTPSSSQASEGLSQVVLSPTRPFTRSQTSPIPVEKRQAQPSSVTTGRRTKSRPQPLNLAQSQTLLYSDQDLSIVRVDLDDFHDFDVLDLGQPQIPQLDAFDSDVDENVEEQVEEYLKSDSEDSDFNVDEQEESDEISLDGESDDNEGIIKALKSVMPQASRRICVLHFYKNFAAHYPGAWFHCFFYIAANANSSFVPLKATDKIKQKEPAAYQWLRDNEPLEHWARFKFDTNLKSADNTNNFVESFNNAISKLRGKPMLTMLEEIRKLITGLPCKHSVRCILRMKGQLEDYYAPWFSTDNHRKLYENIIHPISDPCMWGDTNLSTLDLPVELRKRGRAEKHNRREHFSGTKRCKQCKQLGHTSLTCGRPRAESGRLLDKYKKKRKTCTKPVGKPRKTLCTTGTSAGTSDPTSIATEAPPTQFTQS